MELANIAFHIENTSKRSILRRRWRKCNMKEKLDNLHNENRGKRMILWKFLNDRQLQNGYNSIHTDREESVNNAGDCESMSYESYSLNSCESRATLNQAHLFDDEYSCESLSSSDTSSALSDWLRPDFTRVAGDGMETPDIPKCLSNRAAMKRLKRNVAAAKVTSTHEPCHKDVNRSMENSTRELEYSCTLRLFAEPEEPCKSSSRACGVTSTTINKFTCTNSNNKCVSSTDVNDKDCLNVETTQHIQCNLFTLTKARLRHNATSKLKQLLKLYKASKLNKKKRSTENMDSIEKGNALDTDGCSILGSGTSGQSQNMIHDDICPTVGLDKDRCCAPDKDTVRQDCELSEKNQKNEIFSNRLAEFYDCDGLDLVMDCYCSETDEFAYLNNGFVMD